MAFSYSERVFAASALAASKSKSRQCFSVTGDLKVMSV
jgi:hypothetical protein